MAWHPGVYREWLDASLDWGDGGFTTSRYSWEALPTGPRVLAALYWPDTVGWAVEAVVGDASWAVWHAQARADLWHAIAGEER